MFEINRGNLEPEELELLKEHTVFNEFCKLAEVCELTVRTYKQSLVSRSQIDPFDLNTQQIARLWIDAVPKHVVESNCMTMVVQGPWCRLKPDHTNPLDHITTLSEQVMALRTVVFGVETLSVANLTNKDFKAMERQLDSIIEWMKDGAHLVLTSHDHETQEHLLELPSSFSSLEELKLKLEIMRGAEQ